MSSLHIVSSGTDHVAASFEGLLLFHLRGALTLPMVDATMVAHRAALRDRPTGIGVVLRADGIPGLPATEVRTYATQRAKSTIAEVRAHATTIEADGFLASAARSALTGIFLVASNPYPRGVFDSLDGSIDFVLRHLGADAPRRSDVHAAFDEMASALR